MGNDPNEVHDRVMKNFGAYRLKFAVPVTSDAIAALEARVGHRLPAGYAAFLGRYGFHSLAGQSVVIGPPGDEFPVVTFDGLGSGTEHDIDPESMLDWEGVPDTMLAVASSDCGNVAVSLAGPDAGHVYLCATTHTEVDGPIHLADSFEEFLLQLRVDSEPAD